MNKEDVEFLKQLQHEMLTQDTICQASPRFWVVMQTVRDYWVDDDIDGICIYDQNDSEAVFKGKLEEMVDWIKENFDNVKECESNNGYLEITCEDGEEYFINYISEIEEFLEEYSPDIYSICYYRDREEIVPNTMFITLRECKEHIERNSHNYNKPHSYAMTAWRSPQVEKLYKILEQTNWDDITYKGDLNE